MKMNQSCFLEVEKRTAKVLSIYSADLRFFAAD